MDSNEYITIATTRPETMLGDTAVAVNPKDKDIKNMLIKLLQFQLLVEKLKLSKMIMQIQNKELVH